FAYMASNTVDGSHAGSGTGTVSGYHVSNIHYTTTPAYGGDAYLQAVSFSLDHTAAAANVGAYVYSDWKGGASRFTNCTADDATNLNFTCHNYSSKYGTDASVPSVLVSGITKIVVT